MTHRSRTGGPNIRRPNRSKGKKAQQPQTLAGRRRGDPEESQDDEAEDGSSETRVGPNDVQLLDLIRRSLLPTINSPTFVDDCQRVKSLLYDRQWLEVFTDPRLVGVYAGKWVPSRALCYRDLFWYLRDVREYLTGTETEGLNGEGYGEDERDEGALETRLEAVDLEDDGEDDDPKGIESNTHIEQSNRLHQLFPRAGRRHLVSLGGGAGSELLATGAIMGTTPDARANSSPQSGTASSSKWTGIDVGPWQETINTFTSTLHTSLVSDLEVDYIETDLLAFPDDKPSKLEITLESHPPGLITILFTLLELFSQSRSSTIALLHSLTRLAQPGTLLLVADSASDLGEIPLGENGRKWPVYMVLDLILGVQPGKPAIASRGQAANYQTAKMGEADEPRPNRGHWELVSSSDSRWYRLPEGIGASWPVKVENTRYWYRLYRRL